MQSWSSENDFCGYVTSWQKKKKILSSSNLKNKTRARSVSPAELSWSHPGVFLVIQCDMLLAILEPHKNKKTTNSGKPIDLELQLAVHLRRGGTLRLFLSLLNNLLTTWKDAKKRRKYNLFQNNNNSNNNKILFKILFFLMCVSFGRKRDSVCNGL